jgi:hypothetical protein
MEIETGTVIGVTEGKALVQVQMGEPCAGMKGNSPYPTG